MLQSTTRRLLLTPSSVVRHFTTCEPAQRVKKVFEEYRTENYSRETPSRFKKELLKVFTTSCPTKGMVQIDSFNDFFVNIGRPDDRLSESELEILMKDASCDTKKRVMPVDKVLDLM